VGVHGKVGDHLLVANPHQPLFHPLMVM
jgi:hypothetical protein